MSDLVCLPSKGTTASDLTSNLQRYSAQLPNTTDVESLIKLAMELQGNIFPPLLPAFGILYFLGLLSLAFLRLTIQKDQQKKGPSQSNASKMVTQRIRRARAWTSIFLWAATGLALTSTVALVQTAAGIQFATTQAPQFASGPDETAIAIFDSEASSIIRPESSPVRFKITIGLTLQVLQWPNVALLFIFSVSISAMYGSQQGSGSTPQTKPATGAGAGTNAPAVPSKPAAAAAPAQK